MPLIGYARVSTEDQSNELQYDELKRAGCRRVFEEKASGAKEGRVQLRAAIDFLEQGDTLIVWKLDRLARSLSQLINVVRELDTKRCGIKSLTESIDTTSVGGKLVFHIFGALAEFERGLIRERTMAGLKSARARGRKGGRPKALGDDQIIIVKALLRDGLLSIREVAQQVGVSEATLYKYFPGPRSSFR